MGFEFKLEALRRYRKHQEESLQRKLGELQRLCDQAIAKLNQTLGRQRQTESDLKRMQNEPGFASQVTMYLQFLRDLEKKIEIEKKAVAEAQQMCAKKQAALLEAVKKRKTLEKLKENGLKAHIAHLDHEEQKFIDEMAVNRFSFNRQ